MQPAVLIARLPSASSKPLSLAMLGSAPQLTAASERLAALEVGSNAGKSEELELELESE
jgi:hypothetical protein